MTRSRAFTFTVNNPTHDDLVSVMVLGEQYADYLIVGDEEGIKGTKHLQGYVHFHQPFGFDRLRFLLMERAHIEVAKGNSQQNYDYCSKEGQFYESGILPKQGAAKFEQIVAVMEDPQSNFHLYQQYKKTYKEYIRGKPRDFDPILIVAKSELRYDLLDKFSTVCIEDWEDVYDDEEALVVGAYTTYPVQDWQHGYSPKIRRGYELIPVNPRVVIIFYNDIKELHFLNKKYSVSIDYHLCRKDELERLENIDVEVLERTEERSLKDLKLILK